MTTWLIEHLRFNKFSSCVLEWLECTSCKILTILESCLVTSFPDEFDPISVSEIASSITLESEFELWDYEFPMNFQ